MTDIPVTNTRSSEVSSVGQTDGGFTVKDFDFWVICLALGAILGALWVYLT